MTNEPTIINDLLKRSGYSEAGYSVLYFMMTLVLVCGAIFVILSVLFEDPKEKPHEEVQLEEIVMPKSPTSPRRNRIIRERHESEQ